MSYIALYRAYRPTTFNDVAGQEVIVRTLKNSVKNNKIGHAYVFSGPRGTGKTSIAKILAKAINCENPVDGNPCNKCATCLSIINSEASDVIEIDGASNNGVDEIRELRDKVKYLPSIGKYKVYIIDEVHMLTTGAFNALLKTLEEPPAHVIFILATTEVHKIPATILSRCQRYDFRNIDLESIIKRIEEIVKIEKIKIEDDAIKTIAQNAQGGLRDALSLLDQAVSFTNETITNEDVNAIVGSVSKQDLVKLLELINKRKTSDALILIKQFLEAGKEEERLINDLIVTLRDLLLVKVEITNDELYDELKDSLSVTKIYHFLDVLIKTQNNMKFSYQKQIYLEIAIIEMIEHDEVVTMDLQSSILDLRNEINNLKTKGIKQQPINISPSKGKPLVVSKNIEDVLQGANHTMKNEIEQIVYKTNNISPIYQMAHHLLKDTELVAASNTSVIFTHRSLAIANQLMQDDLSSQVMAILNHNNSNITSYYVILESDWLIVRNRYVELLKSGQKFPSIGEYDFKLYETKKVMSNDNLEPESVRLAKEYFGEEIVEIKE